MPIGLGVQLGLGGGRASTSSGASGGGIAIFSVALSLAEAAILARSGDPAGTIAYGTDTENYYIFNGSVWFNYPEQR